MTRYLGFRLLQAVGVLWAAWTVSFLILYVLPGDPVKILIGPDASDVSPAQLAKLRHQLGLDQPLIVQYVHQLGHLLQGNFGVSIGTGRPVIDVVGEAVGPTVQIAAAGLVLAVVFGGGVALLATVTRFRWLGQLLLGLPPLGVSIPGFWFALLLIQWFSFGLPIFPAIGDQGASSLVLPAITLALPTGATIAQLLSKSLVSTLREPYIDTAWAKGASGGRIHLRHALRNAALPALTVTGLIVGQLLSGTVVTETIFSRPGLGRVTATAVQQQDIPVVQGVVLFAAAVFVVVNLIVDVIYPLLDPRIVIVGSRRRLRRRLETGIEPEAAPETVPEGALR
ncbi:peptide ABC transporter permease [Frondihabitans sucicola]|uniref:Peptide ABC transporter permease n=1 Tax=Frondihabitans sucicola TaxID=1268041 RepID=A0ABM8GSN0_9MICO|nr:ABC transporter permease [Frondihabitans sucicola]BDZ51303.1 peptide ABC transporter permease [Frondihabitans sucicola]